MSDSGFPVQKIPLAMSPLLRTAYLGVAGFSLLFALAAFGPIATTEDPKELFTLVAGIAFFGFGGLFIFHLLLRKAGHIELNNRGMLLDTYLATGLVEWSNFEKVAVVRIYGMKYLGIKVKDLEKFLAVSDGLTGLTMIKERSASRGLMGLMLACKKLMPLDVILPILGWPELPKTGSDADMLAFNVKAWGYHMILPAMWLTEMDRTASDVQRAWKHQSQHQPTPVVTLHKPAPEPTIQPHTPTVPMNTDLKTCPMCAEQIRAAAAVCRFCRYSFEKQSFVA